MGIRVRILRNSQFFNIGDIIDLPDNNLTQAYIDAGWAEVAPVVIQPLSPNDSSRVFVQPKNVLAKQSTNEAFPNQG